MIPIVYQDDYLLVVHKPAGLLVHRSELALSTDVNLVDCIAQQISAPVFPIHRLDRATTGLLVLAKSASVSRELCQAFANREVTKHYLAVVRGWVKQSGHAMENSSHADIDDDSRWRPFNCEVQSFLDSACLDDSCLDDSCLDDKSLINSSKPDARCLSLMHDGEFSPWQCVDYPLAKPKSHLSAKQCSIRQAGTDAEAGSSSKQARDNAITQKKIAKTFYRPLAYMEWSCSIDRYATARYSVIELQPITGRAHQLRRHMKHLGHPMIGDVKYGKGTHNRFFRSHLQIDQLMLAATGLGFQHPVTQEPIELNRLPNDKLGDFLKCVNRSSQITGAPQTPLNQVNQYPSVANT